MSAQVLGARANRAAVGDVNDSRRNAQRAQAVQARAEKLLLRDRLPADEIFSGGEMRERAFERDVRAIRAALLRRLRFLTARSPGDSSLY